MAGIVTGPTLRAALPAPLAPLVAQSAPRTPAAARRAKVDADKAARIVRMVILHRARSGERDRAAAVEPDQPRPNRRGRESVRRRPAPALRRALVGLGVIGLGTATACARPTPDTPEAQAARRAADVITAADMRQRIGVIADDSLRGRPTPSPELDKVAAYIAGEFQRIGLRPGGDSGTFFQRYPIRVERRNQQASVTLTGRGRTARWQPYTDIFGGSPPSPLGIVTGRVVLLLGTPADTGHPFGAVNVRGAVVVQIAPRPATPGALRRRVARQGSDRVDLPRMRAAIAGRRELLAGIALQEKGAAAGARGWIRLSPTAHDPGGHAPGDRYSLATPSDFALPTPAMPILIGWDSVAIPVLRAAGIDPAVLSDTTARGIRALRGVTATIDVARHVERTSAPNVIGVLEGSDPQLKNEYVFLTAHMDHVGVTGGGVGCRPEGADSLCNGADDNASGAVGVVALARAFAALNPRPRRSIAFVVLSGEERGLWGSGYYVDHPTLPLAQTVADLNLDMIGRHFDNRPGWRDTLAVIGNEHSSLGRAADRVAVSHPELRLRLIDDIWPEENFFRRSDHFNFARKGVPVLFLFGGTHPDYHGAGDSVNKLDAEKAERVVRMIFYLGLDVANAAERPQWNPASRARIVEAGN
jgi:hypothetical protein